MGSLVGRWAWPHRAGVLIEEEARTQARGLSPLVGLSSLAPTAMLSLWPQVLPISPSSLDRLPLLLPSSGSSPPARGSPLCPLWAARNGCDCGLSPGGWLPTSPHLPSGSELTHCGACPPPRSGAPLQPPWHQPAQCARPLSLQPRPCPWPASSGPLSRPTECGKGSQFGVLSSSAGKHTARSLRGHRVS